MHIHAQPQPGVSLGVRIAPRRGARQLSNTTVKLERWQRDTGKRQLRMHRRRIAMKNRQRERQQAAWLRRFSAQYSGELY